MADEPTRVDVRVLRENLSDYLQRARRGASFMVMLRGEPVAELRAPSILAKTARQPGLLKGRITMADDFDTLPDDLLEVFEGREA